LASLARTWEQSYHRIRSLYGISDELYSNTSDRLFFGPGQGSTIGPFLWLLCFILISMSLSKDAPKISLQSVDHTTTVEYVGEAFVDDTVLGTNDSDPGKDSTASSTAVTSGLITNLRRVALEWKKLLFSTGGALNLEKCFWFLLSWKWNKGRVRMNTEETAPGSLKMTLENGITRVLVKRVEPTLAYRTLGVHITPSHCSEGAISVLMESALQYCSLLTSSKLSRQEALTSYVQYLLPKLPHQPPLLCLTRQECDKVLSPVLRAVSHRRI